MLTGTQRRRLRRIEFWNKNPHCYWCGCLTILECKTGGRFDYRSATIDHLFDRYDTRRYLPCKGEQRYVLSCWKCNNDRSKYRTASIPIEELRKRSGRAPQMIKESICNTVEV